MKSSDFIRFYQINHSELLTPRDNHTSEIDSFFEFLALRIKKDFNPRTVLDCGCGDGNLVLKLLALGIQASGIEYTKQPATAFLPKAEGYCRIVSHEDLLPQKYDLVLCLETLPYLELMDAKKVIEIICDHTNIVLFSSSPLHHNQKFLPSIQSPDYWAGLFSDYGFFRDLSYPTFSILPWIMLFNKDKTCKRDLIIDYERLLWRVLQENRLRRAAMIDLQHELSMTLQFWRERSKHTQQNSQPNSILQNEAQNQVDKTLKENELQYSLNAIHSTYSWKLALYIQKVRLLLIPLGSRRERWMYKVIRLIIIINRRFNSR